MIGGFHVAALVRHGWQREAEQLLLSLAEANRQGTIYRPWEFNEWLHGDSGHPMGLRPAGVVGGDVPLRRARRAHRQLPLFDDLLAAKPRRLQRMNVPENVGVGGVERLASLGMQSVDAIWCAEVDEIRAEQFTGTCIFGAALCCCVVGQSPACVQALDVIRGRARRRIASHDRDDQHALAGSRALSDLSAA
jgi:hypothetical protein